METQNTDETTQTHPDSQTAEAPVRIVKRSITAKDLKDVKNEPKDAKEFKINIKTPEKTAERKSESIARPKFTAEQLNMLVTPSLNMGISFMNKEGLTATETANFSAALFVVGEINGWWDKVEFIPYLVLIGVSLDLMNTIRNKPEKKKIIQKEKQPSAGSKTFEPADIINEDELTNKINSKVVNKP